MQTTSIVKCENSTVDAAPRMPPWRRGRVASSESSSETLNAPRSLPLTKPALKLPLEDDASTTTGCSDVEDNASTLSRSSSGSELGHVVSRDAMLLYRARCPRDPTGSDVSRGLHTRSLTSAPPGLTVKAPPRVPVGFAPPPGLALLNGSAIVMPAYTPPAFRKEFMAILKDLAMDRNVARAVRRVRAQGVPSERQAAEYADAITFILEETRGAARRSFVALLAGLAYGVFERKQCAAGLDIFFRSVYPDLQAEVPKLSKLVTVELLPTLGSVFTAEELSPYDALVKA